MPMSTQLTIFLDLEETVIDEWRTHNFLEERATAIRDFVRDTIDRREEILGETFPVRWGVMSWAIETMRDVVTFNETMREGLESFFDITFDDRLIWTVEDWRSAINCNSPFNLNRDDFADFGSKENTLFWLRNAPEGDLPLGFITLIDDVVSHKNKIITENRAITLVNSKEL